MATRPRSRSRSRSRSAVRRLATARLISITGGAAAFVALNFTVYTQTGSFAWLTAALVLTFGTQGIVGPFAGAIGDRFDRRRVMIVSDLLGAVFFLGMSAVTDRPALLLGFAFFAAIVELPFESSSAAAIPNLAGEQDLAKANSLVAIGRYSGIAVGPLIGGVLVDQVGPTWVFLINGISFVVSAVIVWTIHAHFSRERSKDDLHDHGLAALRAGISFLRREPVLWRITLAWSVLVLGLGMSMIADIPLAEEFGLGGNGYGYIIGAWGAGSVVGSILGRFMTVRTEPVVIVLSTLGIAITSAAIGLSPVFWVALVALFLNGTNDAIGLVAEQSLRQRRTPDALRARVLAASESIWQLAMLVSFLLAGSIIRVFGARAVYVLGGVFGLLAALVLLPVLHVRREGGGSEERSSDPVPQAEQALNDVPIT
ncbi:MAG: MFS transporter [Actinomycetota bacterium]